SSKAPALLLDTSQIRLQTACQRLDASQPTTDQSRRAASSDHRHSRPSKSPDSTSGKGFGKHGIMRRLPADGMQTSPMAFDPYAFPMDDTIPGYFIYRDTPPGQHYDPAAPPVYFPAKDSDELFDALRLAFPHVKSHSERMRDAMIKFLLEERQAEQMPTPMTTIPESPWQHSWPSMSSSGSASTLSSPETFDLATPMYGMTPQPQVPALTRQYSTAPSVTETWSGESSPPALEGMTGVFSVSTIDQPKQRIRRKMTEAEKAEYRKRRIAKACDKCAKRKRKCNHNQPDMDTLATKQKITKTRIPATATTTMRSHKVQPTVTDIDNLIFDDLAADMQLFDNFTDVFDDPMPLINPQGRNFDHVVYMTGDFSRRMESLAEDTQRTSPSRNQWQGQWHDPGRQDDQPQNPPVGTLLSPDGTQNTTAGQNPQTAASANSANSSEACRPDQIQGADANAHLLWEHLRSGQAPTDNRAIATRQSNTAQQTPAGLMHTGVSHARTSLSAAVLKLSGTTKAIRAFGRLLKSNGPASISLQLVTLSSVVGAIAQSHASAHTGQHLLSRVNTIQAPTFSLSESGVTATVEDAQGGFRRKQHMLDMFACMHPKARHPQSLPDPDEVGRDTFAQRLVSGPLEGMSIGDYLRMKTNVDDISHQTGRGGQALPSMIANTRARWSSQEVVTGEGQAYTSVPVSGGALLDTETSSSHEGRQDGHAERVTSSVPMEGINMGDSPSHKTIFSGAGIQKSLTDTAKRRPRPSTASADLASTSVPVPSGAPFQNEPAAQEGRPVFTLGEGMAKATSPSTELYLLKRRIPTAMHCVVDRDDNSTLQTTLSRHQTNGGAYLRLGTDNHTRPILGSSTTGDVTIDSWVEKATRSSFVPSRATGSRRALAPTPAHLVTRPTSASAPQADESPTILANAEARPYSASAPPAGTSLSRSSPFSATAPPADARTSLRATTGARATTRLQSTKREPHRQVTETGMRRGNESSVCDVYVHKKRSTFRNKDHFGRIAEQVWEHAGTGSQVLAVLAGVLVLAAFLRPFADAHATTLCLLALAVQPSSSVGEEAPMGFLPRVGTLRPRAFVTTFQGMAYYLSKHGPRMLSTCKMRSSSFDAALCGTTGKAGQWRRTGEEGHSGGAAGWRQDVT
ncbi:hypothetical protein LTR53_011365, partial [Teratosphaeriaceae sp. CCFEE 6253]